ncbi:MAG: hypothetical protein AB7N76_02120 [Planctomycetota bacterium]
MTAETPWNHDLPLLPGAVAGTPYTETCTLERTEVFERIIFAPLAAEPAPAPTRTEDYAGWSKAQLYERAQALGIPGRSRMTKQGLLKALRAA